MTEREPVIVTLRNGATHLARTSYDSARSVVTLACAPARSYPIADVITAPVGARGVGCRDCARIRRAYRNARRQLNLFVSHWDSPIPHWVER